MYNHTCAFLYSKCNAHSQAGKNVPTTELSLSANIGQINTVYPSSTHVHRIWSWAAISIAQNQFFPKKRMIDLQSFLVSARFFVCQVHFWEIDCLMWHHAQFHWMGKKQPQKFLNEISSLHGSNLQVCPFSVVSTKKPHCPIIPKTAWMLEKLLINRLLWQNKRCHWIHITSPNTLYFPRDDTWITTLLCNAWLNHSK